MFARREIRQFCFGFLDRFVFFDPDLHFVKPFAKQAALLDDKVEHQQTIAKASQDLANGKRYDNEKLRTDANGLTFDDGYNGQYLHQHRPQPGRRDD